MNRKRGFAIIGIIIICVILIRYKHVKSKVKPGVFTIKSTIAEHPEIDMDILIKNTESQEEYSLLTQDTVVSGEIEVALQLPPDNEAYTYVEYKINGFNYNPGYLPSYGVTIDSSELPDGWNQLLVFGYKDQLEGVKQVIFKVKNNTEKKTRATRQDKVYKVGELPSYKRGYIPVLMYHDFQENIEEDEESAVVHPDLFEEQLKILLEHNYTPITFKDLELYLRAEGGLPAKPIIITADDGYLSNYKTAFPILKKYNIPATFFVTTRYVGLDTASSHFTWEQAQEMEDSGLIDIQSHTHSHMLLNTLPDEELRHQVDVSFGLIEQNLGERDVKVLAYPQFYHNKHTQEQLIEEGVDLQITRLGRRYPPRTEAINIQRIHVANYTSPEMLIKEIKKLTR